MLAPMLPMDCLCRLLWALLIVFGLGCATTPVAAAAIKPVTGAPVAMAGVSQSATNSAQADPPDVGGAAFNPFVERRAADTPAAPRPAFDADGVDLVLFAFGALACGFVIVWLLRRSVA